jgi:O-acetyl-ADP-ribose deacetylase (regulator of RNase III)
MLAMLRLVIPLNDGERFHDVINIVACPGRGTGVGRVPFREAARQMSAAYKNFLNPPTSIHWNYASQRQLQVRFGGDDGFERSPDE